MEKTGRFYATSVSSTTVVLSPEPNVPQRAASGTGIAQITLTTTESTADGAFYGTTGTCGRFEVILRRLT